MNPVDPNEVTSAVPIPPAGGTGQTPPQPAASAGANAWTPPPTAPPLTPGGPTGTDTTPSASRPDLAEPLTPPAYESTLAWAPAQPVVRDTPARRGRGSRVRWAVALAVIALVVTSSAVVAALLVGRSPDATILGYVPDNSVMYGELRLDLPGDQRQAVGQFLSKFPGFADQAALEGKLDEVLDQLVDDATTGEQSYTANIKPWFSGELGVAVGPLPEASKLTEKSAMDSFRGVVLLSIKDPAGAQTWFDGAFKKAGVTTTTETYNGATVTLFAPPDPQFSNKAAFAIIDGKVALIGDETSVKAAVDTNGNSGFADQSGPKTALDTADSDHIGFVYVELRKLMDWSMDLRGALSDGTNGAATTALSQSVLDMLPAWGAYWLRVESDALVMEAVAPQPADAGAAASDHSSTIVDHVPSTAIAVAISNDYGKTVDKALEKAESDPTTKQIYDGIEQALGLLGGGEAVYGWMGDAAIVVNVADGTPEGGLLIQPTNASDAQRFFSSVKTLLGLGGQQIGATVREEDYNGTTITIVDLGNAADLVGKLGEMGGAPVTPPVTGLPKGNIEIAYATTDDLVVLGSGPAFVKHVLDTTKATSLGGDDRYQSIASRAGKGSASAFVDVAAIRGLLEDAMAKEDPAKFAEYQKNAQPFLTPFDALVASNAVENDLTHGTVVITVK
jgi:hypothetical protein